MVEKQSDQRSKPLPLFNTSTSMSFFNCKLPLCSCGKGIEITYICRDDACPNNTKHKFYCTHKECGQKMHNHGVTSIVNFLQVIANGFIETLNKNLIAIKQTNHFYDQYRNLINYLERAYRHEEKSLGNVKYLSIEINTYYDFFKNFQIELN